jgi:putative endonuclease
VVAYILYSDSSGKYYTGHCADLTTRLMEHNAGETSSIKQGIPWRVVWIKECTTRSEAMGLEKKIKSRGAKRFLQDLGLDVA